jgi:hypothetical protein
MAVLLESCPCHVCGQCHDFCLPRGWTIWWEGEVYAFTCPATGQEGRLKKPDAAPKPMNRCPDSAVALRPW